MSQPKTVDPRIVAHRGVHSLHAGQPRENTLVAVEEAIKAKADWVEIDIQCTKDGEVIVLHDLTAERLWSDPRRVSDLSLNQIRTLGGGDNRIPLLAEVLTALEGSGLTLLIDISSPVAAAAAVQLIEQTKSAVTTVWCGAIEALAVVRERLPQANIWLPWGSSEPPSKDDLNDLAPSAVNIHHLLVGPAFIQAVHELNLEVVVWTVDDPNEAVFLARCGVDSITTNNIEMIRQALRSNQLDERARQFYVVEQLANYVALQTEAARRGQLGKISEKTDPADLVTEVDRSVEHQVRMILRAQFPDHEIVGEEYGGVSSGMRPCWYIDPIDGTTNLACGVPWTSFSLSLLEDGRPVVAALLDPIGCALDPESDPHEGSSGPVAVVAAQGQGAWRLARRVKVREDSSLNPLSGDVVTTELAGARAWPGLYQLMDVLADQHCTLRIPGSGTATLAGVALGRGAAAIIHRYSPIDHGAAILVVHEAGGVVLDQNGIQTLNLESGAVIVGRNLLAAQTLWQLWHELD